MVLSLRRSADGVSFDSVKNALRVPVLSLRYERYSHCAPHGIVSALQRYSASDIIKVIVHFDVSMSHLSVIKLSFCHHPTFIRAYINIRAHDIYMCSMKK